MEENVWPEVADVIDDYTLVSLYVDQDTELQQDKDKGVKVEVNGKVRQLHTVGNRWSYFQNKCFMTNTQPYYALVTPEGELLAQPVGYTPDVKTYHDWLQQGLEEYKSKYSSGNPM
jgi:thiol:disulfide interchange protein DsbD